MRKVRQVDSGHGAARYLHRELRGDPFAMISGTQLFGLRLASLTVAIPALLAAYVVAVIDGLMGKGDSPRRRRQGVG